MQHAKGHWVKLGYMPQQKMRTHLTASNAQIPALDHCKRELERVIIVVSASVAVYIQ